MWQGRPAISHRGPSAVAQHESELASRHLDVGAGQEPLTHACPRGRREADGVAILDDLHLVPALIGHEQAEVPGNRRDVVRRRIGARARLAGAPHQRCVRVRGGQREKCGGGVVRECAFGQAACRRGLRVIYCRLPRLLDELALAKADGTYAKTLRKLARAQLLIIDNFVSAIRLTRSATTCSRSSRTATVREPPS